MSERVSHVIGEREKDELRDGDTDRNVTTELR